MATTPMSSKRLPFKLPEWAPVINWASAQARDVWQPRIQRVSAAWLMLERESVAAGVRPSALQNVTPDELPELMKALAPRGLIVLPLSRTPRAQGYQSASRAAQQGEPLDYRCAITTPEHAAAWADAWTRSDDDAIGRLLGTPECCREFFDKIWKVGHWLDTTVPMVGLNNVQTDVPPGVNMLWRVHGIRPVSHLPCSFSCQPSLQLAAALRLLMPADEGTWMDQILSWPVLYTSVHGVAEITSPVSRTNVATDAFAEKVTIRYRGTGYPEEGAVGVAFPHRQVSPAKVVQLVRNTSSPADNGFASREVMDAAHKTVLEAAGGPWGTVLDLGCGDGSLLARVPAKRRVGVESDAARAKKAERRIDQVFVADCSDASELDRILQAVQPDLIIAQRDRNPPETLAGYTVLSYSYEAGAAGPVLIEKRHADQ